MAESVSVDAQAFHSRLSGFLAQWRNRSAAFRGVGSIIVLHGKSEQDLAYNKNNAFQYWLLGYEFPATLLLLTPDAAHIVTTKKKAQHLEPLQNGKVPLHILTRSKDPEENKKHFSTCLDIIKKAGVSVCLGQFHSTG